jgi:hypothetical protein
MLDKHRRSYSDYNCSLSFTDEDELVYGKMLKDKLFEELDLNELNYKEYLIDPFDDFIWFEVAEPRTGRTFDINVCELYRFGMPEASGVGLAVVMYECFEDEQGFWNTDLSKELSFKLEIISY